MKIGIDGNEANIENRVGVNVYAFDILRSLKEVSKGKHRLIVYLKSQPRADMPQQTEDFTYKVLPGGSFWIIRKLMPYLYKTRSKPDVIFTPSHYLPPLLPIPGVFSIMDLGYLESSGQFKMSTFWQLKYWTARSITISKSIIAISNATKKDIVRHYPRAKDKIVVTPLAYDKNRFSTKISQSNIKDTLKKYSIVSDYILFLSTLKPNKNVTGLIEAFSTIYSKYPNVKLVISGKKGWMYDDIFRKVQKLGLENAVIFTGYVAEKDKPALMAGAKVFAAPSFWEGFGLHVLESMAVGTPVVVSNAGSLPEVVGDAGTVVDPNSIESIANGLDKVLTSTHQEYNKLVEKGLGQVDRFDWTMTAEATLKVLEDLK